jgi:cyclopropane-fatty-acyl-phospholipid synthase
MGVAAILAPVARRVAGGALATLPFGVRFWDGSELPGPPQEAGGEPRPTVLVRSPRALERALREPNELGFGRAWVAGELDVEGDLEQAMRLAQQVRGARLTAADRLRILRAARAVGALHLRGPTPPAAETVRRRGRKHTLSRDRAVIQHHYDVSNRFYRLMLGPTMVYSCAYFADPDDTLEEAQERKLDVICRKLRLREGDRLLDVGCGWGSLVIHAATRYGARAVGVTISEAQAELARERVREAGVADRCEIRLADYREVDDGPYDKIASVGMYEHVGRDQLPVYVERLGRLTRPGGLVLNHGITRLHSGQTGKKSFVWRYVFPDGELHPVSAIVDELQRGGLEVRDVESIREHYAFTLRRWVANLIAHHDEAAAEAGEERERVWRLYMTGSALSFERGDIGVYQVLAVRPEAPHELPLARADVRAAEAASAGGDAGGAAA